MLMPISCPESAVGTWTGFAHSLSIWFMQPLLVLSSLAALFGCVHLVPQRLGHRFLKTGIVTLAAVYLMILSPSVVRLAEKGLEYPIPPDPGAAADAVVVLGRGQELNSGRLKVATALWEQQRAPMIFASGIVDAPQMLNELKMQGIPETALQGEDCSRTTYENTKYTTMLLKPQVRQILLVTDPPHMLRSVLTFQRFGFNVIPVPAVEFDRIHQKTRTRLILREYLGLVSYRILGRFSPSNPDNTAYTTQGITPPQEAAQLTSG